MHAGTIPIHIFTERFAMKIHVNTILLAQANEEIASNPYLVSGTPGALAENLELPLTFGHFGVDAFVINPGVEAKIEVGIDDFTGDTADVLVSDSGVVLALRSRVAGVRETQRPTVFV